MHCSDEELVAHLDGELSRPLVHRVSRHLKSCWHCRTRMALLEKEIHKVTEAMDKWDFPGRDWEVREKHRLTDRLQAFEAGLEAKRTAGGLGAFRSFRSLGVMGAVAVTVVGAWILRSAHDRPLSASESIRRAVEAESTLYTKPVHQILSIEIDQRRPAKRVLKKSLEIWTDPGSRRFASRLKDPDGVLQHAAWQPSQGVEMVQDPRVSPAVVRRISHVGASATITAIADYGLEPEQLEAGFIRWLNNRAWSPISFASNLAVWAADDGTVVQAERLKTGSGSPVVRLTAQRTNHQMTAVLTVDVDSTRFLPKLQTLRFETPERSVEVRFGADIRPIQVADLAPAVFRPDIPEPPGTSHIPVRGETPPALSTAVQPTPLLADPRIANEIEAEYYLHRAGACIGEPVRIEEVPEGVRVSRHGEPDSYPVSGRLEDVLSALADLRRAPSASTDVSRHAWALQHLEEKFPTGRAENLQPDSSRLMELMVQDHAKSVLMEIGSLGLPIPEAGTQPIDSIDWRETASHLILDLQRLRKALGDGQDPEAGRLAGEIAARLRQIAGKI